MTCEGCQAAEQNPRTGLFIAACMECEARALAHSLAMFTSAKQGRDAIELCDAARKIFGEQWERGIKRAKYWRRRIGGAK